MNHVNTLGDYCYEWPPRLLTEAQTRVSQGGVFITKRPRLWVSFSSLKLARYQIFPYKGSNWTESSPPSIWKVEVIFQLCLKCTNVNSIQDILPLERPKHEWVECVWAGFNESCLLSCSLFVQGRCEKLHQGDKCGVTMLASDWSRVITGLVYWPLIGQEWSHDLDFGLSLVKFDHVTHVAAIQMVCSCCYSWWMVSWYLFHFHVRHFDRTISRSRCTFVFIKCFRIILAPL